MNFFKSKNVKIFPCYSRGYFDSADQDGNTRILFDPEARLITETNFANIYGNVLGRRSYIVEVNEGDQEGKGKITKVVIQGYYFELTDFAFAENQILHIKLTPSTLVAASDDESERITYSLASLAEGVICLDVKGEALSYSDDDNKSAFFCTAIGYTSEAEGEVEEEGYYSLAYNGALRLDLQGETFIEDLCTHAVSTNNPHRVTAAQVELGNVENKSTATIKSEFTGEIAEDNTGFVTGGAVYAADKTLEGMISNLEVRLGGVTNVMNFRGAVTNFTDVKNPAEGDVITFSAELKDGDAVVAKARSEWVYDNKEWVEIGTADASDAAIVVLQNRMTEAEEAIDDLEAEFAAKGRVTAIEAAVELINDNEDGILAQANAYADGLAGNYDAAGAAADAASEVIGTSTDPKTADTIYGAKNYADAQDTVLKTTIEGTSTDASSDKTIAGAKKCAEEKASAAETNAKTAVIGASTDDKNAETIYGAKAFATDAVGQAKLALVGGDTDTTCAQTIKGAKDYADSLARNYDQAGSAANAEQNAKDYAKGYADSLAVNYDSSGAAEGVKTELLGDADKDDIDSATITGAKKYADSLAKTLYGDTVPSSGALTLSSLKGLIDNLGGFTSGTDTPQIQNLAAETLARIAADTTLENAIGAPKNDEEEKAATGLYKYIDDTLQIEAANLLGTSGDNSEQITLYGVKKYFIEQLGTPSTSSSSEEGDTVTAASGVYANIEAFDDEVLELATAYADKIDEELTARINGIVGISGEGSTPVTSLVEEQQLREAADKAILEKIGTEATPGEGTSGENGYVAPTPSTGLYLLIDSAIANSNTENLKLESKLVGDAINDDKDDLTIHGLRKRIDDKVASIGKIANTAITVDNTTDPTIPKIGLSINETDPGNVALFQTDAGLSATIDLGAYKTDTDNEGKYKQLQTAVGAVATEKNVFIEKIAQDTQGVITTYTKAVDFSDYRTAADQDFIDATFKTKQTAVNKTGSNTQTITTVTQNENGEIEVVYSDIAFPVQTNYAVTYSNEDVAATETTVACKRHTLTQNGQTVCTIDIPRDLVIKSGSVDKENNELVLVLVNDQEIRVDVSHLIEYVTGGATDTITVSVDPTTFEATATINDASIKHTKFHADVNTYVDGRIDDKINELDVQDITGFGVGKTLASLTEADGKISAAFQDIAITTEQVTDISTKYKQLQAAVVDPTTNGTAVSFIDTISQDAQGKITVTKKTVDFSSINTELDKKIESVTIDSPADYQVQLTVDSVKGEAVEVQGIAALAERIGDIEDSKVTGGTASDGVITININNDFVATATINDKTITYAKFAEDVNTYVDNRIGAKAKLKQTAYSEAGNTKKTITSVTQDENGEIKVTYEDINFSSHNHNSSEITDFSNAVAATEVNTAKSAKSAECANKVACALTIKTSAEEEADVVSFDGSKACTIDISHVAQVASEINKLTGDDTVEGSVANIVKTAIEDALIPKGIYAVAFDANGGKGYMQPQVVVGSRYILPVPSSTLEAPDDTMQFIGWRVGEQLYDPDTTYELPDNTILKAEWGTEGHGGEMSWPDTEQEPEA